MPSLAKPTIGQYALGFCILLAIVCGLQFFKIRNMDGRMVAQAQSADARIAKLENAIAQIKHRLSTPRTIPVVMVAE